ncbi:MAG TPA: hypothetical protein VGO11_01845, partial [Chthoniobacteraceae bacterium]|nr:hypothetical protein [Chthoniobacteraceae bacterium]
MTRFPSGSSRALAAVFPRRPLLRWGGWWLAMLLAGCASDAPYDYGLGLEVIRLDENTRALLATRPARPWAPPEAKRYLRESMGTLQRLHDRGLGHRSETPDARLIEFLRRRFELLAARKAPITRQEIGRLAPAIAELREWESRRGYDWHGEPGAVTFAGDDSFDATDDISSNRR